MEPPATPRRGKAAAHAAAVICNRCIPKINDDLFDLDCNATFGAFKKKCTRCANARHACVAVEPPMFPLLAACMEARASHAYAQRNEAEDEDELRAAALAAGDDLIEGLAAFDRNRNKVTGDRPTPRKRAAGAAPGGLNEDTLLELQSLRRGIFALVEVGKALLRDKYVEQSVIDRIDTALGPDAPDDAFPGSSDDEMEG